MASVAFRDAPMIPPSMPPVKLEPAYVWCCPVCSEEHFLVLVADKEGTDKARKLCDPTDTIEVSERPTSVNCPRCGNTYPVA